MNYKLLYDKLINKYRELNINKSLLTETHHIIPRCLNGSNDKQNLIIVPTRVHYILHLLLWKIKDYSKEQHIKLTNALFCMSKMNINKNNRRQIKINSKLYELYSNERKKLMSEQCKKWGSVTPKIHYTKGHLGCKHSDDVRKKMSKKRKLSDKFGRKIKWFWAYNPQTKQNINVFENQKIPENFIKGRYISKEIRQKQSLARKGKIFPTQETRLRMSISQKRRYNKLKGIYGKERNI